MQLKQNRTAFTLIEVLISTVLLTIVLIGLYSVLDTQRRSVYNVKENLERSVDYDRAVMVLYNDILHSDGNITLKKGERDRLCMESTRNSLYELGVAKVCWLVLKDGDTLIRIEGNGYRLPIGLEQNVEVDKIFKGVNLFDITRKRDKILVVIGQVNKKEPYTFLLQGIKIPPKPKPKPKPKKKAPPKKKTPPKKTGEKNNTTPTEGETEIPPEVEVEGR